MELSEVAKIVDLTNADAANRYLAAGWKLLNQYTTAYDTEPPGCFHQTQHFVLAWYGDNPVCPESPDPEDRYKIGW